MRAEEERDDPLARVRAHVQAAAPDLEPRLFDRPLPTSAVAAEAVGASLGQIAKSILFEADGRFGLFVTSGDRRIDPKVVAAVLGAKRPRIATPEEVHDVTGFQVGAVCPFALRTDVPVFLDASLSRFPVLYTAAGVPESLLGVTFERLVRLSGGHVIGATAQEGA